MKREREREREREKLFEYAAESRCVRERETEREILETIRNRLLHLPR